MARTKKVRKTNQDLNLEVQSQLKKSRVWVGLAIVLLTIGVGTYFINNNSKGKENSQVALVSPKPSSTEGDKVTASPVASSSPKPIAIAKKVKTLADTNGEVEVTVQPGDSFWKISERVCGSGKYFLDIQSDLGYTNQSIHPGDKLVFSCPE